MIRSMTGYGTAETIDTNWTIRVEVRSVNHSDLKVSPRLPEALRLKESDLVSVVKDKIGRGQVYVTVSCDVADAAAEMMVDKEKLRGYLDAVKKVVGGESIPLQAEAGSLLDLPDILASKSVPSCFREEIWPEVVEATELAMDDLIEMREAEGANLAAQLRTVASDLAEKNENVASRLDECLAAYQNRLTQRVNKLIQASDLEASPDKEALAKELAMIAEKSDISEEITRMRSHVDQFISVIDSEKASVGKKLEFIVQEMLREANTMSAKLPSSDMVELAVDIKSDVQKLREQVRNIE